MFSRRFFFFFLEPFSRALSLSSRNKKRKSVVLGKFEVLFFAFSKFDSCRLSSCRFSQDFVKTGGLLWVAFWEGRERDA